jgi:hypothetical protein
MNNPGHLKWIIFGVLVGFGASFIFNSRLGVWSTLYTPFCFLLLPQHLDPFHGTSSDSILHIFNSHPVSKQMHPQFKGSFNNSYLVIILFAEAKTGAGSERNNIFAARQGSNGRSGNI